MDIPDELLIERWKEGDEVASEALLRRYTGPLFSYLYRVSGDTVLAEELVQETALQIWRDFRDYDPRQKFSTWVYAIATNRWRDYLRRERRRQRVEVGEGDIPALRFTPAAGQDPFRELEQVEMARAVRSALLDLTEEHRLVLILRHYQDLSYEEIGGILDCPVGTVKSRIHYALTHLRQALVKRGVLAGGRD